MECGMNFFNHIHVRSRTCVPASFFLPLTLHALVHSDFLWITDRTAIFCMGKKSWPPFHGPKKQYHKPCQWKYIDKQLSLHWLSSVSQKEKWLNPMLLASTLVWIWTYTCAQVFHNHCHKVNEASTRKPHFISIMKHNVIVHGQKERSGVASMERVKYVTVGCPKVATVPCLEGTWHQKHQILLQKEFVSFWGVSFFLDIRI